MSDQYVIKAWQESPRCVLLFVENTSSKEPLVLKKLSAYKDTRYSLETLDERHRCLIEALRRNRIFTPKIYIGLARWRGIDAQRGTISIDEVIENPTETSLDEDAEYVLLMKLLEEERRLDQLLAKREYACLLPLAEYVATIHKYPALQISLEESIRWGSYDHLMHKLDHNLELLDFLVSRCNKSDWPDREELVRRVTEVKVSFRQIAGQKKYPRYFDQRIAGGYIKHCHGDIKSPHIWLASEEKNSEQERPFNFLDAVDFNPMYNHIDVLSDFAMLIADVQARTDDAGLVDALIDRYLTKTYQDNAVARAVLDYYIMEKAIVGTGISILYDGVPDLGRAFLKVAETRLASLR